MSSSDETIDPGSEHHRLTFERPRFLGVALSLRGFAVLVGLAAVVAVVGIVAGQMLVFGIAAVVAMSALLIGAMSGLAYLTWKKGPRSIAVHEHALVVVSAKGDTSVFRFTPTTRCNVVRFAGSPQMIQLGFDGQPYGANVQSIAPKQVKELVRHIEERIAASG